MFTNRRECGQIVKNEAWGGVKIRCSQGVKIACSFTSLGFTLPIALCNVQKQQEPGIEPGFSCLRPKDGNKTCRRSVATAHTQPH